MDKGDRKDDEKNGDRFRNVNDRNKRKMEETSKGTDREGINQGNRSKRERD